MASAKERERRDASEVSAKRWVENKESGVSHAYRVPEGRKKYQIKKEGEKYYMDVIPYVAGKGNPNAEEGEFSIELTYFVHPIGPNGDYFCCPAKNWDQACPVCEERGRLLQVTEFENEAAAKKHEKKQKALRPKERQLYNVRNPKKPEEGVQLFDYSEWLFGKYIREKIDGADEKQHYDKFASLGPKGKTLKIVPREEAADGKKWLVCSNIEFMAREEPLPDGIVEKAMCLEELLIRTPYEKLKKLFYQEPDTEEQAGDTDVVAKKKVVDDDDTPTKSKPSKASGEDEDAAPPKKSKPKEDDDAPPPKKAKEEESGSKWKEGMTVSFEYKGEVKQGTIAKVDDKNEIAHIEVKGREKPAIMDFSDLTLVKKVAKEEEAPPPKKAKFEVGDFVIHDDHGKCEIIRIDKDNGTLTLEDSDSQFHKKIDPDDVRPAKKKPVAEEDAPPKKTAKKDEDWD